MMRLIAGHGGQVQHCDAVAPVMIKRGRHGKCLRLKADHLAAGAAIRELQLPLSLAFGSRAAGVSEEISHESAVGPAVQTLADGEGEAEEEVFRVPHVHGAGRDVRVERRAVVEEKLKERQ